MKWQSLSALFAAMVLAGCSSGGGKTLGELRYQPEPEPKPGEVKTADHDEVRTEYEELLSLVDDENLKEQIERRIGHVYMLEGDQEQTEIQPEPGKSHYVEAIKSYREILEKYPNSPDNAEILYQLAKAYDMEGNLDEALEMLRELTRRHPNYKYTAEANFRKGDILFNRGAYKEAEQAYGVVTRHIDSRFYLNAHYMQGWSQYKQLRFRDALDDFVHVLNQTLRPGVEMASLSDPDQSLVNDTLHAVSLSLDKLAGAASIESMPALKDQHYVWMVYDNLGQYYLDKELYEASAGSYRAFIANHPNEDVTPVLHRKMIDTYMDGSFPKQAFEEKEKFVDSYGIYSEYARSRGGISSNIKDSMQAYLDELASNYHARGQELQKKISDLKEQETENEQKEIRVKPEKLEQLDTDAIAALDKAAYFYQQYIDTFPDYEKLDELYYLRAEALFAARRFEESVPDYERVAYNSQTPVADKYAADAGYAAIIAYERHIEVLQNDGVDAQPWRARAVESMLQFAETFHQDERSASVLTNAAEYIFSLDQFPRALRIATDLIENNENLDRELKKTAYGIMAHSLFKLERFDEASEGYLNQRSLVAEDSEEHQQITERLASSVYKHSETIIADDDKLAAAEELLRLKQLAPDSPVRITGQYDAASLFIELNLWDRAIPELQQLMELYPEHKLAVEFPRKLAFAYEKNEDWVLAAQEYSALSENDPDRALRRESLYLSGTMYENAGDYESAIAQLKAYANSYPEPFATVMEARYKLVQNYERVGDKEKRLFWLQELVEGDTNAGSERTDRSRWLGAWANAQYGDHYAQQFNQHSLSLPLDQSLPAKNSKLEKATARYQAAADSGVFEFVTMSAYKIGELYQTLANDLRNAPRPDGLGAEDQKLYTQILEEQAQPFDQLASDLHQSNVQRAWDGEFNQWINQSFTMMGRLQPKRFAKDELIVSYGDEIR